MSVDTTHNLYKKYINQTKLCRDVLEGTETIVKNASIYTPFLTALDDTENKIRVKRASFDNYTARALDGFTGLIFSKNPTYDLPTALNDFIYSVDLGKKSHIDLAQECTREVLATGRVGLLVDVDAEDKDKPNPYIAVYPTESIINWRMINNKLVMVVLKESEQVWTTQFDSEIIDIYRVLYINNDGYYEVAIYKSTDENPIVLEPKIKGKRIDYIPFVSITSDMLTINPTKPPIYDLADSNLSYHRLKVDLYHSLFFTVPTPYGTGIQKNEIEGGIQLGSSKANFFSDPQAKLAYLEFTGQGLTHYFTEMESCKQSMASLGAEFLRNNSSKVEAAETVALRSSADRATLISVADTVSRGMEIAFEYVCNWLGLSNVTLTYSLNKDYNLVDMTAQEVTALTQSWLSGAISKRDLFEALQKGEKIDPSLTYDDWVERFESTGGI